MASAFAYGNIDSRLAETLVVSIPKVDNPISFVDFCTISLCNVLLETI